MQMNNKSSLLYHPRNSASTTAWQSRWISSYVQSSPVQSYLNPHHSAKYKLTKKHNHHRLLWTQLLDSCPSPDTDPNPKSNPKSKSKLSPRQLITTGLHFTSGLTLHHTIEEQHIFPVLARKMPQFRTDLVAQHRAIHAGLGKLETYLQRCRGGEADLDRGEVRRIMDSFGGVLWAHLDDEVRALGAENMRLYWTVGEMGGLPM